MTVSLSGFSSSYGTGRKKPSALLSACFAHFNGIDELSGA
jgi:hypothetical protein